MQIMLNKADLSKLQPATVADILSLLKAPREQGKPKLDDEGFDWDNVVDLSFNQVQHFMETISDPVSDGLRYIAENGPIVWGADLLEGSEISTLKDFQGATTKRTRNVTKVDGSTLLGWDDWNSYEDHPGKYGVTDVTHASLRRYFEMD
jgi:hypothetical protein